MEQTPQAGPSPDARTVLDPALADFLYSIRTHMHSIAGENPSIATLRHAARAARIGWSLAGPRVDVVPTPDFGMPVRLFRPPSVKKSPLLIYLHGGGWTLLGLDTHDRLMRAYAIESGWSVLGLDYPLAPEMQFPASLLACDEAVEKIVQNAEAIGVSPERIVLGGDSSGANLALSVELHRRATGRSPMAGLLLNYGVFDSDLGRPSYKRFGGAPFLLTADRMEFFWTNYCATYSCRTDPRASPLRSPTSAFIDMPPVHLTIAAQDVLVDENLLFAEKLKGAGVNVSTNVYENAAHGFLEAVHWSSVSDKAIADGAAWLCNLNA